MTCVVFVQLSEGKNREEQLRQQMADKEEKTKKVFMGAKTKISQLNSKFHSHKLNKLTKYSYNKKAALSVKE